MCVWVMEIEIGVVPWIGLDWEESSDGRTGEWVCLGNVLRGEDSDVDGDAGDVCAA